MELNIKEELVKIVENYLESRKIGETDLEKIYGGRLASIGIPKEHVKNILLNMDDEWTNENYLNLKIKNAKMTIMGGYAITIIGIILTILTFFNLILNIQILCFGPIGGGIVMIIIGISQISKIEHEKKMRKYKWKNWI